MNKLEVFFDYACPFCRKGYEYVKEILPLYETIEVIWRPCEAHPRPDSYGSHSDLCIRGMFYAQSLGIDMWLYHDAVFRGIYVDNVNIEDIGTLAEYIKNIIEPESFKGIISKGKFKEELAKANNYAYQLSGVWAVPVYRMNGKRIDSIEDIGISKQELKGFLDFAVIQ